MPAPRSFEFAIGQASKETTFGTPQAAGSLIDWFPVTSADFADLAIGYRTDAAEISGFIGETVHQEESRIASVARNFQASVEAIAWAISMMLGNVTVSGTTPNFTHVAKWRSICTINPPSFTFNEGLICAGATATYWQYKGCVIDQITVEVSGKGFVKLTLSIKTDGSETAVAGFSWPASPAVVNKLIGSMLTLKCGAAGTEDLTSLARSFKFTMTAGNIEPPSIGNVNVVEFQYGPTNPKIDVEFVIKADKSHALYTAMQAKTAQKLDATLLFNANRSINLHLDQGIVNCLVKASGNETQLTVKYLEEHNATDSGPAIITMKTGVAAYLIAA